MRLRGIRATGTKLNMLCKVLYSVPVVSANNTYGTVYFYDINWQNILSQNLFVMINPAAYKLINIPPSSTRPEWTAEMMASLIINTSTDILFCLTELLT